MTLETFFEKFAQFADAPGAVAKMRELVRHFAVTGTLVHQDPTDEPALALLDRIAAHKTALAKAGKLRGPTTVAPMCADEGAHVLPSSWTWVRFGEIMVNRDGERIPVSKEERATKAKTYDYYGASGIIDKIDGYLFDKPLLLIGEDGANLINRSTPIAFIARGQYWVNNHAHVLDGISEDFLQFIELHINAINLEKYVTGSAQPKMNQAKMNSIPIALPPLAEQKRIVAKVDELMALCDQLEAQQPERETRHAALARASLARFADAPTVDSLRYLFHPAYPISPADLRKSILTLAVQGKLVSQDPKDEPAEVFLDASTKIKAKKVKWSGAIAEQEKPFQLPTSWKWLRLGEVASLKHGYAFSSKFFTSEPAPFVLTTPGNFHEKGGFRDRESKRRYYSGPVDPEFILQTGDLIIPMTEQAAGLLGSPAFIPNDGRSYIHNQRLGKLTFIESIVPEFAFWFFNCEFFRGELARTCTGMKVRHTSPDRVLKVPFPVCPLAEQRQIVAKVDQLMALVDQLETQLAASRTTAANLLDALVADLTAARPAPDAEVIDLHSSPEFIRTLLAAEIAERLREDRYFGQVKLQKIIYLAEYHCQLTEIDSRPLRYPAGPHDPALIEQVETKMREYEWFAECPRPEGKGHRYEPLAGAGSHQAMFERLWPKQASAVRALIEEVKTWKTERCERFATAYAAWNDLIIWGEKVTDSAILCEVLERWHSHKLEIPRSSWLETLQWMRDHNYIPTGFGHATTIRRQAELSL